MWKLQKRKKNNVLINFEKLWGSSFLVKTSNRLVSVKFLQDLVSALSSAKIPLNVVQNEQF